MNRKSTSPTPMDHETIERDQVIARYLAGRLSSDEESEFETHYLRCSDCLDQLELEYGFSAGLKQAVAEDAVVPFERPPTPIEPSSSRPSSSASRSFTSRWALAAALVMTVATAFLAFRWTAERAVNESLVVRLAEAVAPRANALILDLVVVRGDASPAVRLILPATPRRIVLRLELDDATHDRYRATLVDEGDQILWSADDLEADAYGTVTIGLDSSFLAPGDHRLRLETPAENGRWQAAATYPFRVVAAAGPQ